MSTITLNDAKKLVRELVNKKEFPDSESALYHKLLWAFVELGEATDAFKKGLDWSIITEELIDTIFYILDFISLVEKTQGVTIDLDKEFMKKWEKNIKRKNHYGLRNDLIHSDAFLVKPLETITIEINKLCFNKCKHCSAYTPDSNPHLFIKYENIIPIIDQFVNLGGKEINISGGEPLLHPRVYDIIDYAKEKNLIVNLFTCGIFSEKYSEKVVDRIIEKIKDRSIDEIMVTLHSSYSSNHDDITGREDSFVNTTDFINKLLSAKQKICVHFVPMQVNSEELEDLIEFLVDKEIPTIQVLRFMPQGRGLLNEEWLSLQKDVTVNLLETVIKFDSREDIVVNLGHPGDFRFLIDDSYNPKQCNAGIIQCMIMVNGDIVPCPAFADLKEWTAGNLFESSLEEIWINSDIFLRLREFDFRRLNGECRGCSFLTICQGRCPAERIRHNENFYLGPDPGCPKDAIARAL